MYNFKDFDADFPNDSACLDFIFRARYANHICECGKSKCFHRRKTRRAYECAWCGAQIYPTAGTIFHKSETSLKSWFFAIFLFAKSKNGVAAKEIERQVGVTYKTAFRMAHKIRELMTNGGNLLSGVIEADETYIGGRKSGMGRGSIGKTPVVGVVERRGEVRATVITNATAGNAINHLRKNVETTAQVVSDESPIYNFTSKFGFKHIRVNHSAGEYVVGRAHTNTIEGFWAQLKRSIDGTHHSVSPKYLQNYVNEFSFRYNRRFEGCDVLGDLLSRTALTAGCSPAKAGGGTSI